MSRQMATILPHSSAHRYHSVLIPSDPLAHTHCAISPKPTSLCQSEIASASPQPTPICHPVPDFAFSIFSGRVSIIPLLSSDPSSWANFCLVCRAWFPVAQKYLLKEVSISSAKHLEQLVSRKLDSPETAKLEVEKLTIVSSAEDNQKPFHHLVPYYIAERLSCEKLVFPVSREFTLHLSHFQSLTDLSFFPFPL